MKISASESRVLRGLRIRIQDLEVRVSGAGFRVQSATYFQGAGFAVRKGGGG